MKERSKDKQFIINITAQLVSFVSGAVISFFLTPYIINNVGSEAYGFFGLANNFTGYATIVTTALNSMAGRFITISIHQNDDERANKYFSSIIIANIAMAIPLTFIGTFIVAFLDKLLDISNSILTDVRILWILIFANFILGLIFNVFSVATFSRNRLDLSSLRSIESNILKIIVLVAMFYFFKPSVWFLGLSTFVCGIYVIATNLVYTKKLLPGVKIKKSYFDKNMIKELISSGMWNSVSRLSSTLSNGLDLLITNMFVNSSLMGIVSVARTIPNLILTVFGTITGVFTPQLTISYAKGDYDDIRNQLNFSIKLFGFISCIPLAFLYIYGKEFFQLWVPTQDADFLQTLSIITCLEFPFVLPLEAMWNIFTVTNKVKTSSLFLLSNSVMSTLIVLISLPFVKDEIMRTYIIVGASAFIGIFRGLFFLPIYGAKCMGYKKTTFYPAVLKNIMATVLATLIAVAVKLFISANTWVTLILAAAVIAVVSSITNYFFILSKSERIILKNKVTKIIHR